MDRAITSRTFRQWPFRGALLQAFFLCLVFAAPSDGGEPPEGRETVRTVDGSASLADMEKGEGWSYNGEYLYALTRGVRDSSLPAGAKVVVFVPAFVVDTAFLPVALLFGLFG